MWHHIVRRPSLRSESPTACVKMSHAFKAILIGIMFQRTWIDMLGCYHLACVHQPHLTRSALRWCLPVHLHLLENISDWHARLTCTGSTSSTLSPAKQVFGYSSSWRWHCCAPSRFANYFVSNFVGAHFAQERLLRVCSNAFLCRSDDCLGNGCIVATVFDLHCTRAARIGHLFCCVCMSRGWTLYRQCCSCRASRHTACARCVG